MTASSKQPSTSSMDFEPVLDELRRCFQPARGKEEELIRILADHYCQSALARRVVADTRVFEEERASQKSTQQSLFAKDLRFYENDRNDAFFETLAQLEIVQRRRVRAES